MKPAEVAQPLEVPVSTVLHWGRTGLLPGNVSANRWFAASI